MHGSVNFAIPHYLLLEATYIGEKFVLKARCQAAKLHFDFLFVNDPAICQ